jgi:hypothetical protein
MEGAAHHRLPASAAPIEATIVSTCRVGFVPRVAEVFLVDLRFLRVPHQ